MPKGENNKWKSFFYSRWFLLSVFIFASLVVLAFFRAYYRDYQVKQEISNLQDQARNLEAKKIETMEILKYVQSKDFVEKQARVDLNLIKPGEKVTVVNGYNSSTGQPKERVVKSNQLSNLKKWWNYFIKGE